MCIRDSLTPEWGNTELRKEPGQRHPILQWYQKLCAFQKANSLERDGIYTGTMTGSIKAYITLAYDLYLCAHNAKLLPLLVKRLKNPKNFEGALYETFVLGSFVKAGFEIEMEEEDDSTTAHCEFIATHPETGRKFSVEAKAVTSESKRAGATPDPPRIREKIYRALEKNLPHERIIFIELNRAQTISDGVPDWVSFIDADIMDAEKTLTISGAPPPPAYIVVTNRTHLHNLDAPAEVEVMVACGFKIDDFAPRTPRRILEMAEARERHIELHWLMQAAERHAHIPSTFDDRTEEEAFHNNGMASNTPRIGDKLQVQDERGNVVNGVVADGIVDRIQGKAFYGINLENGRWFTLPKDLSESELAIYDSSPDTFFGVVRPVSKGIKRPLDAFDFVHEAHKHTPREKLLELMSSWPDPDGRKELSQEELARLYSATMADTIIAQDPQFRAATLRPTANNE